MSNRFYNDQWREVQSILEDTIYADNVLLSSKPSKDKNHLCKQSNIIIAKYILAINKLGECYDQMIHPQKRALIRKILDYSIIRYLELKNEMVNLTFSEFTYLDEAVQELGLIPQEIELKIPECYKHERRSDIKWKVEFINDTLRKMGIREEETPRIEMTEEEAILLIQRHERARQNRIRAQFMKNIREMKDRTKEKEDGEISDVERRSALKIQRAWRGFITRRKIRKQVVKEMLLIGMLQPESFPSEEREKADKIKSERYEIQEEHETEFQKALTYEKEEIKKQRGNIIMEEIRDGIRNWYLMYKQQTGKFPAIPSEDHGSSRMVVGRQSPFPGSNDSSRSMAAVSTGSKSSRSKKSTDSQEEKRKRASDDDFSGFKLASSNILSELDAANAEYKEIWQDLNEEDNPSQSFVLEMIRTQKTTELEEEFRKIVDIQIRVELENLQAALERDEKGKRIKKASKKKARRSGKKSKKKKDKDLTPDRSVESLFEELIENGIIRNYPYTPISSFVGEMSFVGYHYQSAGKNFSPSLGDIRQVIKEYCILPMSSESIHQGAPLIRSVLLAGPRNCGKNMLVNAICTELGAVLFDLSPANIVGKYPGKAGLIMLIHLINKVSKLLQPSIIYINDAEKTFLKKVPKTDRTDPKRLKKDLSKIVKSICPNDLVMLIGVTHAPWECDQKFLMQTYNKVLMFLRPDYVSVNMLWPELLMRYNAFNREIDFCTLTKLSDGYTAGTLIKAMQRLMTCKRMLRLKIQPLRITEILEVLSQLEPVYKEEEDAFLQWYIKTPLGRSRQKAIDTENEQAENDLQASRRNTVVKKTNVNISQ